MSNNLMIDDLSLFTQLLLLAFQKDNKLRFNGGKESKITNCKSSNYIYKRNECEE